MYIKLPLLVFKEQVVESAFILLVQHEAPLTYVLISAKIFLQAPVHGNAAFDHRHYLCPDERWRHLSSERLCHETVESVDKSLFKDFECDFLAEWHVIDHISFLLLFG